IQRVEGPGGSFRPPALLVPHGAVVADRLLPAVHRVLDRHRFPAWTPHAGPVHGQEDREEPGSEPGLLPEPAQLVVRPDQGLLIEIVPVVRRPAEPPGRGHGLLVNRPQEPHQPFPAGRVRAGVHVRSSAPWWVPTPETPSGGRRVAGNLAPFPETAQ